METHRSRKQSKTHSNKPRDKKPPKFNQVLFQSKRADWNTPQDVLDPVRAFAGPTGIGIDPCSNATSIVGARTELRLDRGHDGLAVPWGGHGRAYVNPPYTRRDLPRWIRKVVHEARLGVEIILLVAARVDTKWFAPLWTADAICFWRGRIVFIGAVSGATFPSALVYFGSRAADFDDHFRSLGQVVFPNAQKGYRGAPHG